MDRFKGKIGVITGAGSGIGYAVAERLVSEGLDGLLVTDIRSEARTAVERLAREGSTQCVFVQADAGNEDDAARFVRTALESFGRIDIFHNNAGISGPRARLGNYPESAYQSQMDVNLRGIFLGLKNVLPHMVAARSGVIVNTASTSGLRASPGFATYTASKHGVIALTRAAAVDYARSGVRVNAICPGPTVTEMGEKDLGQFEGDRASLLRETEEAQAAGRRARPIEVAAAVAYLCSDDAEFVNGTCLVIDGGFTAADPRCGGANWKEQI